MADPDLMVTLYYSNQPVQFEIQNRTLDRILSQAGFLLPDRHPLRTTLLGTLRGAIAEIRMREQGWNDGDFRTESLPKPVTILAAVTNPTSTNPAPEPLSNSVKQVRPLLLSKLFQLHIERMKPKAQSISEQKLALRQLKNIIEIEDPFVHEISFEQAEKFYATLKWLPKSMTAHMALRPLTEIASDMSTGAMQRPRAAGATAAKKLHLIHAMFAYAEQRGHLLSSNPFAGLAGRDDSKPQTKRTSMEMEKVDSIFSAPLFQGAKSYEEWRHQGDTLIANHRFWLPLLGLATGTRIEEVGQLLVSDIKLEDDILFIDITEDIAPRDRKLRIDKSLKTSASIRRVPLHQIVLDAGFTSYLRWLQSIGEPRMFPELPATGKKTKDASRWFNRDFRASVGITEKDPTFHSFRHLFKDRCRAAKLPDPVNDALTGHSTGTVGSKYGRGMALENLKEGIDKLTFPAFRMIPPRTGPFRLDSVIGAVID